MAHPSALASQWGTPGSVDRDSRPLPGTTFINASNDVELVTPILEGDRLSVVEEVVSVSPEKRTRVGVGHFVETRDTYYRDDGVLVATNRNTLFRFTPAEPS